MKKNILLAIDSSGAQLQLALINDKKTISFCEDVSRGYSEIIFDRIATLFSDNKVTYDNLTRIAVITGPGSFTGLRSGIAAARAIAFAKHIEIIGVPTLLALSLNIKSQQAFSIIKDARRNEIYCQDFLSPAKPKNEVAILAKQDAPKGDNVFAPDIIDIEKVALFASNANPNEFPAFPNYVRSADAKPQTKNIIATTLNKNELVT